MIKLDLNKDGKRIEMTGTESTISAELTLALAIHKEALIRAHGKKAGKAKLKAILTLLKDDDIRKIAKTMLDSDGVLKIK